VRVVENLRARGLCDAVLAAAGSGGASVLAPVFRALPLGVPKLLVTTMGGYLESLSKTRDITLMQSVTDIAGLNRISRQVLRNAAFAAAGMAMSGEVARVEQPLVAVTMFGVTTPGVLQVERRLRDAGFETIIFHAVGSGGRAMEEMVGAGLIDGLAKGPVVVMVPLAGFDSYQQRPDGPWIDTEADARFLSALRRPASPLPKW
jgi:uncharacterized protein (UPF0261 family)